MKRVEKSAKTYEEAVTAALLELNAAISDVDVEVLEEGSKGLFGLFGSRPTKVCVTLREKEEEDLLGLIHEPKPEPKPEPRKEQRRPEPVQRVARKAAKPEGKAEPKPVAQPEEKPAPKMEPVAVPQPVEKAEEAPVAEATEETRVASAEEKPARPPRKRKPRSNKAKPKAEEAEKKPLPPKVPSKPLEKPVVTPLTEEEITPDSAAGKARAFLQELTRLMGVEVTIAMGKDEENNLHIQMSGDTLGVLIGRRGETLDALQYLTSLRVNRGQEGYTRVTLDTENYRAKREDTLIRLANRMANRAVKTGRKVSLEPMNPYERRIIHSALQANEAVDTHSEGEDPNRHVVITLRKA